MNPDTLLSNKDNNLLSTHRVQIFPDAKLRFRPKLLENIYTEVWRVPDVFGKYADLDWETHPKPVLWSEKLCF